MRPFFFSFYRPRRQNPHLPLKIKKPKSLILTLVSSPKGGDPEGVEIAKKNKIADASEGLAKKVMAFYSTFLGGFFLKKTSKKSAVESHYFFR